MIGGVAVDENGATSLPRLWAAGEVTSSGLHGANRLASNSLLEGLVFGAKTGEGASREASREVALKGEYFSALPLFSEQQTGEEALPLDLADIRNSLKSLMWRNVGVQRTESDLKEALKTVTKWQKYVLTRQFADAEGWELQNLLTVSCVMINAALKRCESRGVHQRLDYPETDDDHWLKHICFQGNETSVEDLGTDFQLDKIPN